MLAPQLRNAPVKLASGREAIDTILNVFDMIRGQTPKPVYWDCVIYFTGNQQFALTRTADLSVNSVVQSSAFPFVPRPDTKSKNSVLESFWSLEYSSTNSSAARCRSVLPSFSEPNSLDLVIYTNSSLTFNRK